MVLTCQLGLGEAGNKGPALPTELTDATLLTEFGRGEEGNVGRLSKLLIEPGLGDEGSVGRLSNPKVLIVLAGPLVEVVVVVKLAGVPGTEALICKCTGIASRGDIDA